MSLDKTAIKNERPAVMASPKVRPPGEGDVDAPTPDASVSATTDTGRK
jgi:hypothetical protein